MYHQHFSPPRQALKLARVMKSTQTVSKVRKSDTEARRVATADDQLRKSDSHSTPPLASLSFAGRAFLIFVSPSSRLLLLVGSKGQGKRSEEEGGGGEEE